MIVLMHHHPSTEPSQQLLYPFPFYILVTNVNRFRAKDVYIKSRKRNAPLLHHFFFWRGLRQGRIDDDLWLANNPFTFGVQPLILNDENPKEDSYLRSCKTYPFI